MNSNLQPSSWLPTTQVTILQFRSPLSLAAATGDDAFDRRLPIFPHRVREIVVRRISNTRWALSDLQGQSHHNVMSSVSPLYGAMIVGISVRTRT